MIIKIEVNEDNMKMANEMFEKTKLKEGFRPEKLLNNEKGKEALKNLLSIHKGGVGYNEEIWDYFVFMYAMIR